MIETQAGQIRGAFSDVVRSARLYYIWLRLAMQNVRHKFRRSTVGPAWILLNLGLMIAAIGVNYGRLLAQNPNEFIRI